MLPIIFMVYNRPDKAEEVLSALLRCDGISDCVVYAFSDGPRNENARLKVEEVRKVLNSYSDRIAMEITERQENFGCSRNVAESVTAILEQYEYAIYMEDDIIPKPDFIQYMRRQIEEYKDDDSVFSINSYNQLEREGEDGIYFSRRFSSWGSALFRRSWMNVEFRFGPDKELIGYDKAFLSGIEGRTVKEVAPDLYLTYLEHKKGFKTWNDHGDMWDLQCFYYMIANNLVAVTPYRDYSENVGNDDNSGIHVRRKGLKKIMVNALRYTMALTHTAGLFQTLYKKRKKI